MARLLSCGSEQDSNGVNVSSKFVVLRECADQFEAQTIRIRLATEKIPVLITGTDPNVALSLGGAPTSRPVRVEVKDSDLERADRLLQQDNLRAAQTTPWTCSRCHEQNEPTFDVCWSCNKIHVMETANGEPVQTDAESRIPDQPQEDIGWGGNSTRAQKHPSQESRQQTPLNQSPGKRMEENQSESVSRCGRSAVVGLLLFPPFLNFYSVYLLLKLDPTVYRHADTQRRVWSIWIFNTVAIGLGTMLWWLLFFRQ